MVTSAALFASPNHASFSPASHLSRYRLRSRCVSSSIHPSNASSIAEKPSTSLKAARRVVFFTWEPSPPNYLKINFDGCVLENDRRGGAGFVIRGIGGNVIAAGGSPVYDISVTGAELRPAWEGLRYAHLQLKATDIFLEGDSSTIIGWIHVRSTTSLSGCHPLLRDIWAMFSSGSSVIVQHIYREANSAAD